jgi:hypothetical protein
MVRLGVIRTSFATLALIGARPVLAVPITLTGKVETDFQANNPGVHVTPVLHDPLQVGESPFIPANGWVSGWAVKDIRSSYDTSTDTLYVGIDTLKNAQGNSAIIGDADGNGNPGGASAAMAKAGGVDPASLGGHKSVTVAFAADDPKHPGMPGTPVAVAGVPADKSTAGPGLDGFNVAAYKNNGSGIENNYGKTLTANLGALGFDPSAGHPGFEFTIKNFSKIPGLNPANGFWLSLYAGSTDDVVAGETTLPLTRIPSLAQQTITPEPATLLPWTFVAGAAWFSIRRRARRDG